MSDLIAAFDRLSQPSGDSETGLAFSATRLPGRPERHLGKDSDGRPALLICARAAPSVGEAPPVRLENLTVGHAILCRVSLASTPATEGRFTVIHCFSTAREIQEYFLLTVGSVTGRLSSSPTTREVADSVEALVSLFEAIRKPPTGSIQGLWAELFLISRSPDPCLAIQAWHASPTEHFDFSLGNGRIEVKSSSDRSRRHYLSMEQAYPVGGTEALIASLFVEALGGGLALEDLWDTARNFVRHDPELGMKVEQVCVGSLGAEWAEARKHSFDPVLAAESLAFYDMAAVPRVPDELPRGVSEVHFRSDLGLVQPIDIPSWRGRAELFAKLLTA